MKPLLTICFLLSFYFCQGQGIKEFSLTGGIYWNTFGMSDMKDVQSLFNSFPSGSQQVSSFPNYIAFDLMARRSTSLGDIGIWAAYESTGGRNDFQDFSGSFRTDLVLEGFVYGVAYRRSIILKQLFIEGRIGLAFNKLSIDQNVDVFNMLDQVSAVYNSVSPTFWAGLEYQIVDFPKLSLITIIDVSKLTTGLKLKEESIANFFPNLEGFKADWTGVKFGVRIGI